MSKYLRLFARCASERRRLATHKLLNTGLVSAGRCPNAYAQPTVRALVDLASSFTAATPLSSQPIRSQYLFFVLGDEQLHLLWSLCCHGISICFLLRRGACGNRVHVRPAAFIYRFLPSEMCPQFAASSPARICSLWSNAPANSVSHPEANKMTAQSQVTNNQTTLRVSDGAP
jgi:hypothetical protein